MIAQIRAFVASIYGVVIIALLAALIVQTIRIEGLKFWPISVAGYKAKLANERAGRAADRKAYQDAQAAAEAKNKAEVRRIEKEQSDVTQTVTRDLNTRLERLRRELRQAPPAAGGSARGPGAGADGGPRAGTDEASGLCLAPEELLRGAENEERHDRLIDWVEQQLKVQR